MVGRKPDLKIIQSTHTTELAIRFGRKAKTLIDSAEYQQMFKTTLREDSQAAGKWETSQGGEYYAAGVGSAITGRGADLLIIDDPHSEQDALKYGFNGTSLRVVYIRSTSTSSTRWSNCCGYDTMEYERLDRYVIKKSKRIKSR